MENISSQQSSNAKIKPQQTINLNLDYIATQTLIANLKLLGFSEITSQLTLNVGKSPFELSLNMFDKANTQAMEVIVYFLCRILNPECLKVVL